MSCCPSLESNQLIIFSSVISIVISEGLSADELNVLGNFIVSVGSLLLTKAAQLSAEETHDNTKKQILFLEEQVKKLKDSLN